MIPEHQPRALPDELLPRIADEPEPDQDELPSDEPPRPINWNLLTAEEAETEWLELNAWVNWLRHTYGLGPSVIPPLWHRHPELVWELSALRQHWLCAYDPQQHGSAPLGWHRDLADARIRLRDWVTMSGTRLDRDRSTRQTAWPGEPPSGPIEEVLIMNREDDFVQFVLDDVARRRSDQNATTAVPSLIHGAGYPRRTTTQAGSAT